MLLLLPLIELLVLPSIQPSLLSLGGCSRLKSQLPIVLGPQKLAINVVYCNLGTRGRFLGTQLQTLLYFRLSRRDLSTMYESTLLLREDYSEGYGLGCVSFFSQEHSIKLKLFNNNKFTLTSPSL